MSIKISKSTTCCVVAALLQSACGGGGKSSNAWQTPTAQVKLGISASSAPLLGNPPTK